jgi:hypothetical protein
MATFRKKQIEIEAVQLKWETWNEVCDFIESREGSIRGGWVNPISGDFTEGQRPPGNLSLTDAHIGCVLITVHGEEAIARQGDWIIPDGKPGTFYPCKPDIFKLTYEPIEKVS